MVRITKKVDYSILILAHLAGAQESPCSAREISDRFGIARSVVANLLKALSKAMFVKGQRGTRGGYRLAIRPAQITLAGLLEAIEGRFAFAECAGASDGKGTLSTCPLSGNCPAESTIQKVHKQIHQVLKDVTLEDLSGDIITDTRNYHVKGRTPLRNSGITSGGMVPTPA